MVQHCRLHQLPAIFPAEVAGGGDGVHEVAAVDEGELDALEHLRCVLLSPLGLVLQPPYGCFIHLE